MAITAHGSAANSLQFAEVSAVITRADGSIVNLGVIDSFESAEHAARRASRVKRLGRLARRLAPWLLLGALAVAGPKGLLIGAPAATVITNAGKAIVANRMQSAGTDPKYVAWGTGAGTAAATDTTLFTESAEESRTAGTQSRVTTTVTNDTYQVVGTITVATSNKTITNVGLFDASTSGNLFFKSDFTGLALLIGDSITFTIKVAFS